MGKLLAILLIISVIGGALLITKPEYKTDLVKKFEKAKTFIEKKMNMSSSELAEKKNVKEKSKETVVFVVKSRQTKKPIWGVWVEINGTKRFTSQDGKVAFLLDVPSFVTVKIDNGWNTDTIYPKTETIKVESSGIKELKVDEVGSFLPLNLISLDSSEYSEKEGIIKIPKEEPSLSWIFAISVKGHIEKPCMKFEGDSNLVKHVWVIKKSGDIELDVRDYKDLFNEPYTFAPYLDENDVLLLKMEIELAEGIGNFKYVIDDLNCKEGGAEPRQVEFLVY